METNKVEDTDKPAAEATTTENTALNPDTDGCPICLEPIRNPTFLSCGHSFCHEHLNNLERCPLCRHSVNAASSNVDVDDYLNTAAGQEEQEDIVEDDADPSATSPEPLVAPKLLKWLLAMSIISFVLSVFAAAHCSFFVFITRSTRRSLSTQFFGLSGYGSTAGCVSWKEYDYHHYDSRFDDPLAILSRIFAIAAAVLTGLAMSWILFLCICPSYTCILFKRYICALLGLALASQALTFLAVGSDLINKPGHYVDEVWLGFAGFAAALNVLLLFIEMVLACRIRTPSQTPNPPSPTADLMNWLSGQWQDPIRRKNILILVVFFLILLVTGLVLLSVLVKPEDDVWEQSGSALTGTLMEWQRFGSEVALSADGTIVAVKEKETVQVHRKELDQWVQLGSSFSSRWSMSFSADGRTLAVVADGRTAAAASLFTQVFRWSDGEQAWALRGSSINETISWDSALSLSDDGEAIAIGVPGPFNDGQYACVYGWDTLMNDWVKIGANVYGQRGLRASTPTPRSLQATSPPSAVPTPASAMDTCRSCNGDYCNAGDRCAFASCMEAVTLNGTAEGWYCTDVRADQGGGICGFTVGVWQCKKCGTKKKPYGEMRCCLNCVELESMPPTPPTTRPPTPSPTQKNRPTREPTPSPTRKNFFFGNALSLSGDGKTLATVTTIESSSPMVKVYRAANQSWTQEGQTLSYDKYHRCHSLSLSSNGSRLAVVFTQSWGNSPNVVRVYDLTDKAEWVQVGPDVLGGSPEEAASRFRISSVSLSSDGSVLGVGFSSIDQVRIYEFNGGKWTQVGENIEGVSVKGVTARKDSRFGGSIDLSANGRTVAVGASEYLKRRGYAAIFQHANLRNIQ